MGWGVRLSPFLSDIGSGLLVSSDLLHSGDGISEMFLWD